MYFGKIRWFMSLDRTMCRVGRLRASTGVVGACPRRELPAPEPEPALPVGLVWITAQPELRRSPTAIAGFGDFASMVLTGCF
jgi:hypothetical protein